MSDFRIGAGPFFQRGIESVVHSETEAGLSLPGQQLLAPAEHGAQSQLEALLGKPNIDQVLNDRVKPDLNDRDLLLPHKFRRTLEKALGSLETSAQASIEAAVSDPSLAQDHKVLNRAVRLLNEEVRMRDLLRMYQSALFPG